MLLCFGCSGSVKDSGSPGAAGQSAGRGGQGGAGAAQSGAAGESAGDSGDAAGRAGEGNEPGMSTGGTGQVGAGGTGGAINSAGSGGHGTAGSTATGGAGSDECAWEPLATDHCHVCDGDSGCARTGYKYIGSGAITSSCCGLEWQEATAPGEFNWSEAVDYCASLSLLGGSWRLPKIAELYSLVDLSDDSHQSPTVDVNAFADTLREAYWSSSLAGTSGQAAWSVNFSDGASQSTATGQTHRVRCVR